MNDPHRRRYRPARDAQPAALQLTAVEAVERESGRIGCLTARYLAVTRAAPLGEYRVPMNLAEERARTLAAHARAETHNPHFAYRPVPGGYENPLIALMGDIDPDRSVWDRLVWDSLDRHREGVEALRTRDPEHLTRSSTSTFGAPTPELAARAREILAAVPRVEPSEPATITATEFAEHTAERLRSFGLDEWTVRVDENLVPFASVRPAERVVRVRSGAKFRRREGDRLLVHEIGTHVFRAENGRRQSLGLLGVGIGHNTETDEGLAVFNEERFGLMGDRTLREYALRVIAVALAIEFPFSAVFGEIVRHADPDTAYDIAVRVKRGLVATSEAGGFIKDHVYLSGRALVSRLVEERPGTYGLLMAVKAGIELLPVLEELRAASLLEPPRFLPEMLLS